MRNSVGPIVVFMIAAIVVPWWLFPLTRDRVFLSLNLTSHQRKEISRLNDKYKEDLLDLKRRHNESLLNVLDDDQRQQLKKKKNEIDRYLEKIPLPSRDLRLHPSRN